MACAAYGWAPSGRLTVVGSNAAYRTLWAYDLVRVPAGVDAAEAAALILSWTTAYQSCTARPGCSEASRARAWRRRGRRPGALVLARLAGLELWGAARSAHAALIRELGATPIDYQREDFTRVLPGGFDVVFDGIGEDGDRRSFAALKRGCLLCAYGYSAGVQAQRRMLTILMWIARLDPGGGRSGRLAASGPTSTRSTEAGHIPPGSGSTWSGSSACWRRAPSGRASPSASASMRSPSTPPSREGGLEDKLALARMPSRRDRMPPQREPGPTCGQATPAR